MKRLSRAGFLVERLETLLEMDTYLHSGGKPFPSSESPAQELKPAMGSPYTSKNYMDSGPSVSPFRFPSATRTSNDIVRNSFPGNYSTGRPSPVPFEDETPEKYPNDPGGLSDMPHEYRGS